jgi:aminomethyltransferase
MTNADLQFTPLHALHRKLGAKMSAFAGYDMPVSYPLGILKEHEHTRTAASLFDVSHMGQAIIRGDNVVAAFETLISGDIEGLVSYGSRYTLLTNDKGGIRDDLMVSRLGKKLFVVVNAGCKAQDFAYIHEHIGDQVEIEVLTNMALLALQGPKASEVLARHVTTVQHMNFMSIAELHINNIQCLITRSGYTGEDGYEISLPAQDAENLAQLLMGEDEVEFAGLGARDSLRLEAGLCLHGSDIDPTTTPIEASLTWVIGKSRRKEDAFPGANIIIDQIANRPSRKRVGIKPKGRALARAGTKITNLEGNAIGVITSGGFGPTFGGPLAMGYINIEFFKPETQVFLIIRGKAVPAQVIKLPFVPHNYFTSQKQ